MQRHLSVPPPLLEWIDEDDDDSPSDSSNSTPHSSFHLHIDPFDPQDDQDLRHRRHSLLSFDSGYFSTMGKDSPVTKSSNRFPTATDSRNPFLLMNGTTDTPHASPKREGAIMTFLRKRKKSTPYASLSDSDPSASPRIPTEEPVPDIPPLPFPLSPSRSKSCDPSVDAFEERDRFVVRRGMKHHPYSRDDAPYMLAYNRTLLDNDRFSEILLRRLNPNHSPSFHDFSHAPPRAILDLGCGPGGWALEAAAFWPSSQVIGFDLLPPVCLRGGVESPSNVQWKQGNFVKYKLPFPKNTFDLVRMANLSLCVPHERWEHVMSEARRVLNQGGRLELIDDYLYFPYSKLPPQPSSDSHGSPRLSSSFVDSDDDEDEDDEETDTEPRKQEGDGSDNEDDFVSTKSRFSSFVDMDDDPPEIPSPSSSYDPVSEWHRNVDNAKALEKLFEDMLSNKFSVHPRPSKFFDRVIDQVFGRYHQTRLHEFNLYLAPPSSQDSDDSSVGSSDGHGSSAGLRVRKVAKWVATEWDHHKEKQRNKGDRSSEESLPSLSTVPEVLSAKAAGRLGIRAAGPPQSPTSHSHASQSPGLILWPATFIPMSAFELEMHACKHLHSLIGCKAALTEFLQDTAREKNLPFDEQMLNDVIWDYESFRRKRFNWPSECLDSHFDLEGSLTTPRSTTFRNSADSPHQGRPGTSPGGGSMSPPPDPLFPREKLDFVRSIRVYSATKVDEEIHVL